jgi:hypothetical protein
VCFRCVCTGSSKPNNFSRNLLKQLLHCHASDILTASNSLVIPSHWHTEMMNCGSGLPGDSGATINKWMADLVERFTRLSSYYAGKRSPTSPYVYWLGGMFAPEAFVTATRQQLAQTNKWNLEDMELYLELNSGAGGSSGAGTEHFQLEGLTLECAVTATTARGATMLECSPSGSRDVMKCSLAQCTLRWNCASADSKSAPLEPGPGTQYMKVPVYATNTRAHRLFDVHVLVSTSTHSKDGNAPASAREYENVYLQRGVAVIAQSSL